MCDNALKILQMPLLIAKRFCAAEDYGRPIMMFVQRWPLMLRLDKTRST
jgi:hypothetical protein